MAKKTASKKKAAVKKAPVKKAGKKAPATKAATKPADPYKEGKAINRTLGRPVAQLIVVDSGINLTTEGSTTGTLYQPQDGVLLLTIAGPSTLQVLEGETGQPTTGKMSVDQGVVPATGGSQTVTAEVTKNSKGVYTVQVRSRGKSTA